MNTPCRLVLVVFVCGLAFGLVQSEIHRAKTLRTKLAPKNGGGRYEAGEGEEGAPSRLDEPHGAANGGYSSETWIYSMFSACLVGLSGVFPLLVIPLEAGDSLKKGVGAARLKVLLSFAVGGLLGDVFLHLLPEAWKHVRGDGHLGHMKIGLWVLAGLFCFLIVEKIFPDQDGGDDNEDHQHVHDTSSSHTSSASNGTVTQRHTKKRNQQKNGTIQYGKPHKNCSLHKAPERTISQIKTCGWLNLMANVIDNFTHGLAVAGSFCAGTKSGILTTVIILLHEIPHEVGDFAILLRSGFDRWAAAKAQVLTATGGVLGALVALFADSASAAGDTVAWILPFTSGGFIYIALVSVVPELLREKDSRESMKQMLAMVLGICAMAGVAFYLNEHNLPDISSWGIS